MATNINTNTDAASFTDANMKSFDDVSLFAATIYDRSKSFQHFIFCLLNTIALPDHLIRWVWTAHHRFFYTETMSTNRKTPE